jgi:hypothetical protein
MPHSGVAASMSRTIEIVLGVLAGITGVLGSLGAAMFVSFI